MHHAKCYARVVATTVKPLRMHMERRNVEFKMDIGHLFLGYKILYPYFSARAFTHVLELDALDVGLLLWHAWHDTKDKKRRNGRQKT